MAVIKKMLVNGDMDAWELQRGKEVIIVVTFLILHDLPTMTKHYMIYSLTGFEPLSYDRWFVLLNKTRKYAKSIGCDKIIGYSDVNRVLDLVKVLGGKTNMRLIELEV